MTVLRSLVRSPVRSPVFAAHWQGWADIYAPYPAPSGYRWEFVTSQGRVVTSGGDPVVSLVEI